MTLSTDAMAWIWNYFGAVYPPPRATANTTAQWPASLPNISLVVFDVMVYLRNTAYKWREDDHIEEKMTCIAFANQVANLARNILRDNPDQIKRVVLRFDRPGKTTVAKGAIYQERYERVEEYVLPDDGSTPFFDEAFMPGDIHGIFKNPKARTLLYVYLTQFFLDQFSGIGEGQEIIIDGGLRMIGDRGLPFRIFRDSGGDDDNPTIKTETMGEEYYLEQGEADLGCPFWSWKFNEPVILVSEDGDAITIGLLQSLKRVKQDGTLAGPSMLVRKRLVADNVPYEEEEMQRRFALKQSVPSTSLSRSVRTQHYVDIDELRNRIIYGSPPLGQPLWYGNIGWCPFPVEMFCALIIMPKNDFFEGIPEVQFTTIWSVFTEAPEAFGGMVVVDVDNPASKSVEASPVRPLRYGVVRSVFMRFVWACLKKRLAKCRSYVTLASMLAAIPEHYAAYRSNPETGAPPKRRVPSIGSLNSAAANLAWCMAYFSNGSIPESLHKLDYPLAKDKDGNSVHGWDLKDPRRGAKISNVKFARTVPRMEVYWAM